MPQAHLFLKNGHAVISLSGGLKLRVGRHTVFAALWHRFRCCCCCRADQKDRFDVCSRGHMLITMIDYICPGTCRERYRVHRNGYFRFAMDIDVDDA